MSAAVTANTPPQPAAPERKAGIGAAIGRFFSIENRYLPPLFITTILLVSQLSFGVLESFSRTLLAIATAMIFEIVLSKLVYHKFPILASAYITGISVGILCRTPAFWPFALTSAIAITSKYVIRWKGRHLWNPSNFAICTMLLIAPEYFSTLMTQWGNTLWPMLIVWALGAVITYRVKRFHITATYVLSFILFSFIRTQITGHPFFAELAPITGPPYQLYIFFMITDPRTTVSTKRGQIIVAFLVAVAEALFRLAHNVDAPYYALTVVGPVAMAIDLWHQDRKKQLAKQSAGTKLQTAS